MLSVALVFAACEKDNEPQPEPGPINPSDTTTVDTAVVVPVDSTKIKAELLQKKLNSYDYLKTYINRTEHPIFKFSGAIEAWDFNSQSKLRDTLSLHFDEIVAGNSMKYSGCVDGSGNMNFSTVKQFCENAKAAGLTIYGHTLAWHSQQQPGYLLGLMKDIEIDVPDEEKVDVDDTNIDYKEMKSYNLWHSEFKKADENTDYSITTGTDGLLIRNNAKSNQNYMVQYQMAGGLTLKLGVKYTMTIKMKASDQASVAYSVGDWYPNNYNGTFTIDTEMKEYTVQFEPVVEGGFVLFQTGDFVGDIVVESLKITHKGSDKTIPLTDEQKRDTLKWAMDQWIAGMMEATDGFVKAWDVVNEALSGADGDGDGIYDLQNYQNNNISDPSNVSSGVFYWQAFMGDLEYVRTAVASARKHFKGNADELKLFVNDYNLESTWDDNAKVKSLVAWINKWEADGVTKIDGIGTQMHISCYESASLQKDAEDHIVKMFQIMAASGKLCRISELDMGYVRGSNKWGGSIKTDQVTDIEHQKMADFYYFIIRKYFEIIPPAQQYGICQWCLTDAPTSSGWRGGEPVGIWTEGYKARKAAYAGFADGLAGPEMPNPATY